MRSISSKEARSERVERSPARRAAGSGPTADLSTTLVEEHRLGEEHGHYEAVPDEPHYHFTCLGCGEVIEFDAPLVVQIEQELSEREGVRVTSTHLHMSGYCARCQSG